MCSEKEKYYDQLSQLTASSSDLAAALQLSMKAIQHENVDVRIHALTSLRDMMHSNQVRWCSSSRQDKSSRSRGNGHM